MTGTDLPEKEGIFPKNITKDQARDTGMAMVLLCLLISVFGKKQYFSVVAIVLLLLNMIWPLVYKHVARLWLGLSHLLGTVVSKIVLTLIFFVLVTPIGLIRRLAGDDSLKLKFWKKDGASVFRIREHTYTKEDIQTPY
jgi:hypothetical protein